MEIGKLRVNHIETPLGYKMDRPTFTWTVLSSTGKRQQAARVEVALDEKFENLVHDSGRAADISALGYTPEIKLKARTRYFWRVSVWADDGDSASAVSWFETAKMDEPFAARWICAPFDRDAHPLIRVRLNVDRPVRQARVYASGLGVYELELNGQKVGDEYLSPFYNDYNLWVQYQTYDITGALRRGENVLGASLGNGWYKGRFGFVDKMDKLYGDTMCFIAEVRVLFEDGEELVLGTDETWLCHPGPVLESSIYDGETYDARMEAPFDSFEGFVPCALAEPPKGALLARLSPPLRIIQRLKPKLIITPAAEQVLDFGQVMTGWMEFDVNLPKGQKVFLQCGELLQHGNFYNENLRTAKEAFTYISAGRPAHVRPHFTFYGFRYIRVEGMERVNPDAFCGCVMHSDIEFTGEITTSNAKVNQLIRNALWGQRGNFLDVPTDCPQRDERMGWTGDAQVFAPAASFNMYTPAFYAKYLYDALLEQRTLDGSVPHVIPDILDQIARIRGEAEQSHGSCAWADMAAVIPWTMYLFYGDKTLLEKQYENMKLWVDWIERHDESHNGGLRLWQSGFHFADWLALDNPVAGSPLGGTDPYFVASFYYYYSTLLTAKAAGVLGKTQDQQKYQALCEEIKSAIRAEYFTPTGRIAVPTQTAMALSLYLDLAPEEHRERLARDLKKRLDERKIHLDTGFVGTYFLCPALSGAGLSDYAYTLLLNEDYPSWLYEVNMGATTVWERWNSVLPNGLVSDTGMNSMNHYAYGSVVEWMYRHMCGLNPLESAPGFARARIAPEVDARFEFAHARYQSASGTYESGWRRADGKLIYTLKIPFNCQAEFVLDRACAAARVNGAPCAQLSGEGRVTLDAGCYEIEIDAP